MTPRERAHDGGWALALMETQDSFFCFTQRARWEGISIYTAWRMKQILPDLVFPMQLLKCQPWQAQNEFHSVGGMRAIDIGEHGARGGAGVMWQKPWVCRGCVRICLSGQCWNIRSARWVVLGFLCHRSGVGSNHGTTSPKPLHCGIKFVPTQSRDQGSTLMII